MNPLIQIGDESREMTNSEYAEWVALGAEVEARRQAELAKAESAQAAKDKLTALGLTQDEIYALLGV